VAGAASPAPQVGARILFAPRKYDARFGIITDGRAQRREPAMKHRLLAMGILLAASSFGTGAQAQNYPWCEYLGSGMGGAKNCGFISFEQCRQSAWGNGGDCRLNPLYEPPPGPHAKRKIPD
jgi:hypothetical protein